MPEMPSNEDWEREELSEDEQDFVVKLAGLIELSTRAQYNMYAFFDTVPPEIRGAVYRGAMEYNTQQQKAHVHAAPRMVQ